MLIKHFHHLKAKEKDRHFNLSFGGNTASEGLRIKKKL